MDKSDEDYEGSERRNKSNAELRARLNEVAEKISDHPKLTGEDMHQLHVLLRDLYWSGLGGNRSSDLLELVREEYADELSPAMLALLDDVLGRRAGNE